jgi:hypothetical protein
MKGSLDIAISMARAQGAVQALELCLACVSAGGSVADAIAVRCMLEGARDVLVRAEAAWSAEVARADAKPGFGPRTGRDAQAIVDRRERVREAERRELADV